MIVSTSSHTIQLSKELNDFVTATISDALGRFADDVVSVDVFLKDLNGPKGGLDKQALFRIHLRQRRQVFTETVHENLRGAIRQGAKRAKRSVRRNLSKARRIEKVRMQNRLHGLTPSLDV